MSGAGNAFVVLDGRGTESFTHLTPTLIQAVCNRSSLGIPKAEGVIVLDSTSAGNATSTFYNPDGSADAMCGNGSRCLVRFALDNGATLDENGALMFTMAGAHYTATVHHDVICVEFPPPVDEQRLFPNDVPELPSVVAYVDVGSDHVVVNMRDLNDMYGNLADLVLQQIAVPIRNSSAFPRGTNVNFATVVDRRAIHMRTYERGVEAETGACGTGAISTAIALWRSGEVDDDVTLIPTSGKPLRVVIHHRSDVITRITLCGDAIYDAPASQFDTSSETYYDHA